MLCPLSRLSSASLLLFPESYDHLEQLSGHHLLLDNHVLHIIIHSDFIHRSKGLSLGVVTSSMKSSCGMHMGNPGVFYLDTTPPPQFDLGGAGFRLKYPVDFGLEELMNPEELKGFSFASE